MWIRIDSAGFSKDVVDACVCHEATVTITAEQNSAVRAAIAALEMGSSTTGASAKDADGELSGSEVAETTYHLVSRGLRPVVRRQH